MSDKLIDGPDPRASRIIIGVDFGGPRREDDQRRKIVAIAAQQLDWRRYRIGSTRAASTIACCAPNRLAGPQTSSRES